MSTFRTRYKNKKFGNILQVFIAEKPLRVLDFAEPGIFGEKK